MLLTTSQMRRSRNINIKVQIGTEEQSTTEVERLLGLKIHHNLKFREHIQDNDQSLIKDLNIRLKALQSIKKVTSFSQRLAIANGIFLSKVTFLISVWGGAEEYLIDSVQLMMNKAMRSICNVGKSARIEDLLRMTNWLSVRQSIVYFSLMEARRVLTSKEPRYLYNVLTTSSPTSLYNTRHGTRPPKPRLSLVESSWRYRVQADMERLPRELVNMDTGENRDLMFRKELRNWVKENVNI